MYPSNYFLIFFGCPDTSRTNPNSTVTLNWEIIDLLYLSFITVKLMVHSKNAESSDNFYPTNDRNM